MSAIEFGKGAMIKKDNNIKYVYVNERPAKLENFIFSCKDMVGKPFGSAFKVLDENRLEQVDPALVEVNAEEYTNLGTDIDVFEDNRSIQDNVGAQKLGKDDIEALKAEGKSGDEIVKEIVDNNATFQGRTKFSKAKYMKKKKKKYICQFVVLKPCTRLLAEMYYKKCISPKVLHLRPDCLAQILTFSNIQAGSNVLLLENCQGLVVGAILERLGNQGKVLQLYPGSFPVRIVVEQFNYRGDDLKGVLCSYPMEKLACLPELFSLEKSNEDLIELILGRHKDSNGDPIFKVDGGDIKLVEGEGKNQKSLDNEIQDEAKEDEFKVGDKRKFGNKSIKKNHQPGGLKFISREERVRECLEAMDLLRGKNFDSLVLVSKYHPKTLLFTLLKYLPPSSPFVVYFTHQEPLMECYVMLRDQNIATNIDLSETWFRNIQVLPKRTHPEIVMSGNGGYLLKGITIDSSS